MASLSFRYRVPLDISLVVLVTGLGIAATVLWHDYRALRADAGESAERLGRALVQALGPDLTLDGKWQAYRTLRALYQGAEPSWLLPAYVLVVDRGGQTLVTSDPVRFPLAQEPTALGADLAILTAKGPGGPAGEVLGEDWIYRAIPLEVGDPPLGTLILAFSKQALWPRFTDSALRVLAATGALLVLLLPLGWWVGWRIAKPLMELEGCVARLGDDAEPPLACPAAGPYDELGRLRVRVESVAAQLRERQALERQVIRSERQAALGRLAAGVAHEINNPLGGMLTAIAMYKRHGRDEAVTRHTLSLVERGLDQIRHIVSALLVEVKAEPRNLSPRDVDDIAELIAPQVRERHLELDWRNHLGENLPLPAGPVRQVLLNLALNATQASPEGGPLGVLVEAKEGTLRLEVTNAGEAIDEARLGHLFEPFAPSTSGGSGLGLWLTDQAVRQLGGHIEVQSNPGQTRFTVVLPIGVEP
jgi:two-component system, NtrC family, sensor kinase